MKDNLKKNFVWNSIGSTVNAFTSLFFLIIVNRINGSNSAGIFTFAYSNACLFQIFGVYAGRSYQVTEKNQDITDNDYVHNRILSCIFMFVIGILYGLIKGYKTIKLSIVILLIVYKAIDAFCESLYGILQKKDYLYKVGFSLFLKGVFGILVFLLVDLLTKNLIISILSIILTNIVITLMYDVVSVKKCKYKLSKINIKSVMAIFKLGFWAFLYVFLNQYLINIPKYSIDKYLSSDIQTIYGIIAMPATVMILISNFIVHPFLIKITDLNAKNKIKELNNMIIKMGFSVLVIGIMALIFLYFFGIPILNFMYGINLDQYLYDLLIIICGATVFAMTSILTYVLIAMRKTMSQTVIFCVTCIISYFISDFLIRNYQLFGAVQSYLISMILLFALYIFLYLYIIKKEKVYE